MTRSIASYPESQRAAVVKRRMIEQRGGLGYQAAQDAQRHIEREKRETDARQAQRRAA